MLKGTWANCPKNKVGAEFLVKTERSKAFTSICAKEKSFLMIFSSNSYRAEVAFSLCVVFLNLLLPKGCSWVERRMHITWDCIQQGVSVMRSWPGTLLICSGKTRVLYVKGMGRVWCLRSNFNSAMG